MGLGCPWHAHFMKIGDLSDRALVLVVFDSLQPSNHPIDTTGATIGT